MGDQVTAPGSEGDDEGGGDCGDAFAAAGEAEAIRRRRRDADRGAEGVAQHALRLAAPRADLGEVADDLDRGVADPPAVIAQPLLDLDEEVDPGGGGPLGLAGAEHAADVTQP